MSQRLHSLIVDLEGEELTYQYMCREGGTVPPLATFRKTIQGPELKGLADGLSQTLARWSARGTEISGADAELREWGGKLYDRVIPAELGGKLGRDTTASYLVLYLHPALVWIPWELLWDGEQFLCWRFRMARLLQKTGSELRAAEWRLREERSGRGALIVFGDVSRLEADAEKVEVEKSLGAMYGSNVWFYKAKSATDILEQLKKDYEICHFVGHGTYADERTGETGWKFADGTVLTCQDIEAVSSRAAFPLLILANSCDSARPSLADAQGYVSALYRAFLRQGVPHYIGTAARIPDEPSRDFARSFYRLLAGGLSIGEALSKTRQVFSERPGMPIWAYYLHYGDPTYRVVQTPATRPTSYDSTPALAWQDILEYEPAPAALEPFVDREKELAEAKKHLQLLADGKPSVLFLSGEAGVGKSAFLRRLLAEAIHDRSGVATAIGTCNVQLGVTDPYLPFKEIFRLLVRNTTRLAQPQSEALTVGELIVAELLLSFPQLVPIFRPDVSLGSQRWERICQRLSLMQQKEAEAGAGIDQTSIFDQISRLLRRVAAVVPLILAVDNLHWADDSSVALFFHLGRTLADSPILLVGTYRSDLLLRGRAATEHPLRHAVNELRRYGARTVSLDLSTARTGERKRIRAFVAAYVEDALPGHHLPPSFMEKLAEHTGGNALFLTELLKYARERGQIVPRNGSWELTTEVEHFELPESVECIIEERVEQLSEELRETLTLASVEGEDFTAEVLARLQDLDEDKVLSRLVDDLHRMHQLVDERGEHEVSPDKMLSLFHFRNTLIQQHVYQELGAAQRRRLHKKVGDCLEKLYGEKSTEIAGQLATHFRIAREWKKALTYAVEAARASARIYANHEAIRNYRLALELWELVGEKDVALKATLLQELGEVYKYVANFDKAIVTYEQILTLNQEVGNRAIRAYALNGIGDVHRARGDSCKALPYYQRCEDIATELHDEKLLVELWTDLADLFYRLWEDAVSRAAKDEASVNRAKAQEYAERVLRDAERISAWENVRRGCVTLGNIMLDERRFGEAQELYMRATTLAEQHNLAKKSLNNLGEVLRLQGKYDAALEYYNRYLNWAVKTGATRHEMMAYNNMGLVYFAKHDFEGARDFCDRALELNKPLRKRFSAVLALAVKGLTFELQGATPVALELYREALKVAELPCVDVGLVDVYGKLGRMLFAYNEPHPAACFLSRYLEHAPEDAEEIQRMLDQCTPRT